MLEHRVQVDVRSQSRVRVGVTHPMDQTAEGQISIAESQLCYFIIQSSPSS